MLQSKININQVLSLSHSELRFLMRDTDGLYFVRIQPKKKFGESQKDKWGELRLRRLTIPWMPLKVAQKQVNDFLQSLKFPDWIYGSIKGSNNILNAQCHLGQRYFLTIDLKDFFPRITCGQVYNALISLGFNEELARVITRLTTFENSLPQGAPSSPVIANLVLIANLTPLLKLVDELGLKFSCYLDDFTFSSDKCFKRIVPKILNIIKRSGFRPSQNKIHYREKQCEITGINVSLNNMEMTPAMKEKAKTNPHLRVYEKRIKQNSR